MNILITGASRGIGYETAKLLCDRGHTVVTVARSQTGKFAKEQSGKVHPVVFDLEKGNMDELAAEVKKHVGALDALICNAGALVKKPFEEISVHDLSRIYQVNVFSVFSLVQRLLPIMKPGSHIVNISSMGGFQGSAKFAGLSAYSSSKGALATLSECLAVELAPKKIAVNCLCLGAVQTEMLQEAFPGFKAPVSAAQMAELIAHFTLEGHRTFNGKVLPVSLSTP